MGQFGAGIKSIQQGLTTFTATNANPEELTNNINITAVVMAKSIVLLNWNRLATAMLEPNAYLTSTTNLRVSAGNIGIGPSAGYVMDVCWQVIEYY